MKYQKIRSAAVMDKVFDCPHRHGVFTVSDPLREYFLKDRFLLNELFGAVNDTLSFVIRMPDKSEIFAISALVKRMT